MVNTNDFDDKYLCEVKRQYGAGYLAVCQRNYLLLLRETSCRMAVHCLNTSCLSSHSLFAFWGALFTEAVVQLNLQFLLEVVLIKACLAPTFSTFLYPAYASSIALRVYSSSNTTLHTKKLHSVVLSQNQCCDLETMIGLKIQILFLLLLFYWVGANDRS